MPTLEIGGEPIAIACGTMDEAAALFHDEQFRSDLITLGLLRERVSASEDASYLVRPSLPKEDRVFEIDFARALTKGEATAAERGVYAAFLAPVGAMLG